MGLKGKTFGRRWFVFLARTYELLFRHFVFEIKVMGRGGNETMCYTSVTQSGTPRKYVYVYKRVEKVRNEERNN